MGYIVLSKQQVDGGLNVKLCKDRASADSQRKQLIKQYYDVVIIDKSDYDLLAKSFFKDWVYGGEDNKLDGHEINSDKTNDVFSIMEFGDKYFGGDEEAHKAWDKEGEGKVIANAFMGDLIFDYDEQVNLGPKRFYADEDFDEYYLSSNGNRYYLFSKVVTLKGDREQTIYTFGKKEWSKTNDLTLLRFCNIPYDKVVIESKSGYPFLKTEVALDEETPSWVEKQRRNVDEIELSNKLRMKCNKAPKWDL